MRRVFMGILLYPLMVGRRYEVMLAASCADRIGDLLRLLCGYEELLNAPFNNTIIMKLLAEVNTC
jgi:hypothetical protein